MRKNQISCIKQLIIFACLLFAISYTSKAQNANPYIAIYTTPTNLTMGSSTTLRVEAGNSGMDNIVSNSMEITINVGVNVEIIGISPGSDTRWTQFSLVTGAGGTMRLRNTGISFFGPYDVKPLFIQVRGVFGGSSQPITANIKYINSLNPLLGSALNDIQGNTSLTDDNSQTSLYVTFCPFQTFYRDNDGDGYGAGSPINSCPLANLVLQNGDCDDTKATVYPGGTEICDGLDNNCDGLIDNFCGTGNTNPYINIAVNPPVISIGQNTILNIQTGNAGSGQIVANSLEITVTVGFNAEIIGLDPTSDSRWIIYQQTTGAGGTIRLRNTGTIAAIDLSFIRLNLHALNVGSIALITSNIAYRTDPNPLLNGAQSSLQGNTSVFDDNSLVSLTVSAPCTLKNLYRDNDGDGYGSNVSIVSCVQPGYVLIAGDCNDNNPAINPGATEVCDAVDNNCDGIVDNACNYQANPKISVNVPPMTVELNSTGYLEMSAGNYGQGSIVQNSLGVTIGVSYNAEILGIAITSDPRWTVYSHTTGPAGSITLINTAGGFSAFDMSLIRLNIKGVTLGGPAVITGAIQYNPGTSSLLGGALNASQGDNISLDNVTTTSLTVIPACRQYLFKDLDGDGYGGETVYVCPGPGYVTVSGDCNDGIASIHPNAPEVCDGIDNDCDGNIDNVGGFLILAQDEIHMHRNTVNGNLGIWQAGKIVKIHEYSTVNGDIQSPVIDTDGNSVVNGNLTYTAAAFASPAFIYNTMPEPSSDINIPDNYNGTYDLTTNNYRKITVGKNATARFTMTGDITIKELITKDADANKATTITFSGATTLIIRKKLDLGKRTDFNNENNYSVNVFVEEEDVHIGGSSKITASIDCRFKFLLPEDATSTSPTFMTGRFIARKVDAKKWIEWNNCVSNINLPVAQHTGSPSKEIKGDQSPAFNVKVGPNPSHNEFKLQVSTLSEGSYSLKVMDAMGRMMFKQDQVRQTTLTIGASFQPGIYFAEIIQGKNREVIKLIKIK